MVSAHTQSHAAAFGVQHALPHLAWFAAIAGVAFAVPYIFTSALDINHDLYYLIYFAIALAAVSTYAVLNGVDVATMFRQNWQLSLALGVLASAFVVWNVLAREDSTPRPDGAYFAFEFAWRGLAYGVVDAILLSAFPAMVAFSLLGSNIAGLSRRVAFAAIALVLTIIITATYHLGYEQFRDDGIGPPETGNTIISIPTLASGNPIGSIIAHAAMHGAAVTHAYETDVFLPPQTSAD
jgi:hypothetical protein